MITDMLSAVKAIERQLERLNAHEGGRWVGLVDRYCVLNGVTRNNAADTTETLTLDNAIIPAGATGVDVQVLCAMAASTASGCFYSVGRENAGDDRFSITSYPQVNGFFNSGGGRVPCAGNGTNALLYGTYHTDGANMTVYVYVLGYYL